MSSNTSVTPRLGIHQRCWCEISLSALKHNVKALKKRSGHGRLMGMVKANAYGHGIVDVAKALEQLQLHSLGCANVAEVSRIRKAGVKLPILLMSPALPDEFEEAISLDAMLTVSNKEELKRVSNAAVKVGKRASVHLKIDTGMGRAGVSPDDFEELFSRVSSCAGVRLEAVYTHFPSADTDRASTRKSWKVFIDTLKPISLKEGVMTHSCNSAAIYALPEGHADIVRPGLALYGAAPVKRATSELKPVMSWKSRVVLVKEYPKGHTISYGSTYVTPRKMTIGLLSVGYGDGFFRSLSNQGKALINGQKCPIVGRVTMDLTMVDLTKALKVGAVKPGSEAVLMGSQKAATQSAEDLAKLTGTISYEIFTNVGVRVPRFYV